MTNTMRINLIPKTVSGFTVFGQQVAYDELRAIGVALLAVVIATVPMWATLHYLTLRATSDLATISAQVQADASHRAEVLRVAEQLGHFRQIDQDATLLAQSGRLRALRIAELGNALPKSVWYDKIGQDQNGWHLTGRSINVQDVANALERIGRTTPGITTALQDVETRDNTVFFQADIGDPHLSPTTVVPPSPPPQMAPPNMPAPPNASTP